MRTRAIVGLVALECVLAVLAGFLIGPAVNRLLHRTPTVTPTSSQERDASVQALSSLETVNVRARIKVVGYDRSCSPGHGCVFGAAWSDDSAAAGGHNGCDTRNDVLARQLQDVDKGTSRCFVQVGTLNAPTAARQPSKAEATSWRSLGDVSNVGQMHDGDSSEW